MTVLITKIFRQTLNVLQRNQQVKFKLKPPKIRTHMIQNGAKIRSE